MLAPHGSLTRCTKEWAAPEDLHNQALAVILDLLMLLDQGQVTQTQAHQVTQTLAELQDQAQLELDQPMFTAQLWSDSHLASTLLCTVWTGTHVQLIAWMTASAHEDL